MTDVNVRCPHCKRILDHIVARERGYKDIGITVDRDTEEIKYDDGIMNTTEDTYCFCPKCGLMLCPEETIDEFFLENAVGDGEEDE